jgi:hypothetical protein
VSASREPLGAVAVGAGLFLIARLAAVLEPPDTGASGKVGVAELEGHLLDRQAEGVGRH